LQSEFQLAETDCELRALWYLAVDSFNLDFIVEQRIYAFDQCSWSIFPVDEMCNPAGPMLFLPAPGSGETMHILNNVFQINNNGELMRQDVSGHWTHEFLYSTYGDARARLPTSPNPYESFSHPPPYPPANIASGYDVRIAPELAPANFDNPAYSQMDMGIFNSPGALMPTQVDNEPDLGPDDCSDFELGRSGSSTLAHSLHGLFSDQVTISPYTPVLDDEPPIEFPNPETPLFQDPILIYGQPPTRESIIRWVEELKAQRAPMICPCHQKELRRPHALKVGSSQAPY
jgi:hypothetical protein